MGPGRLGLPSRPALAIGQRRPGTVPPPRASEAGAGYLQNELGEITHREFLRVAEIDRPGFGGVDHRDNATDQVVDVTETAGLAAVTVHGDRVPVQRLGDEVGDNASISVALIRGPYVLKIRMIPTFTPRAEPYARVSASANRLASS